MPDLGFWLYQAPDLPPATAAPDWLSPAEQDRWRSHQPQLQSQFVQSRALLRHGLSLLTNTAFTDWRLTAKGPPAVPDSPAWHLSLSHTGHWMLAGMVRDGAVGVDLEKPTSKRRWRDVAQRWFTPAECALLADLDDIDAREAFYWQWTLKEAWVKATGRGLANHIDSLQVIRDGDGHWQVSGDRLETDWRCRAGYWREHVIALIWRAGTSVAPAVQELSWSPDAPQRLLTAHPLDVDWRLDTLVSPRSP